MNLDVFPTHVGMNRAVPGPPGLEWGVPHARGDEPALRAIRITAWTVFPTHVGMNRLQEEAEEAERSVPHARGDEPSHYCCAPW